LYPSHRIVGVTNQMRTWRWTDITDSVYWVPAAWTTGVRFSVGLDFSLRHHVQTGSESHSASYQAGTECKGDGAWS